MAGHWIQRSHERGTESQPELRVVALAHRVRGELERQPPWLQDSTKEEATFTKERFLEHEIKRAYETLGARFARQA